MIIEVCLHIWLHYPEQQAVHNSLPSDVGKGHWNGLYANFCDSSEIKYKIG